VDRLPSAADLGLTDELFDQVKVLDTEGVILAEKGDLEAAIAKFTEAIGLCERFPSPYNNRAQTRQLTSEIDLALLDLDLAIKMADGIDTRTLKQVRLSLIGPIDARGLTLSSLLFSSSSSSSSQAHTQRGTIRLLRGLEEEARIDFEVAATLGNDFARKEATKLNPFAKLCNTMVSQMLKAEREGTSGAGARAGAM